MKPGPFNPEVEMWRARLASAPIPLADDEALLATATDWIEDVRHPMQTRALIRDISTHLRARSAELAELRVERDRNFDQLEFANKTVAFLRAQVADQSDHLAQALAEVERLKGERG